MKKWVICFMVVWFVAYIAAMNYFRFQFGFFRISLVYLIGGIAMGLFFGWKQRKRK